MRASGHMFGPSLSALSGSGWVSMNSPAMPTATAARASTGIICRCPPVAVPFPPEPLRSAVVKLAQKGLAHEDATGKRARFLKILDAFGIGFDS